MNPVSFFRRQNKKWRELTPTDRRCIRHLLSTGRYSFKTIAMTVACCYKQVGGIHQTSMRAGGFVEAQAEEDKRERTCRQCGETKSRKEFIYISKTKVWTNLCKECGKTNKRESDRKNPKRGQGKTGLTREELIAKRKAEAMNPEERKEKRRQWGRESYRRNREKRQAYNKEYKVKPEVRKRNNDLKNEFNQKRRKIISYFKEYGHPPEGCGYDSEQVEYWILQDEVANESARNRHRILRQAVNYMREHGTIPEDCPFNTESVKKYDTNMKKKAEEEMLRKRRKRKDARKAKETSSGGTP